MEFLKGVVYDHGFSWHTVVAEVRRSTNKTRIIHAYLPPYHYTSHYDTIHMPFLLHNINVDETNVKTLIENHYELLFKLIIIL